MESDISHAKHKLGTKYTFLGTKYTFLGAKLLILQKSSVT